MSNSISYEYIIYLDALFNPIKDICCKYKLLEKAFFKVVHLYQKKENSFCIKNYESLEKFFSNCDVSLFLFETCSITYSNYLLRELKISQIEESSEEKIVEYSIKEKFINSENTLNNIKNQYQLKLIIKKLDSATLLTIQINFNKHFSLDNPFNSLVKKELRKSFELFSLEMNYSDNNTFISSVIINSTKKHIFSLLTTLKVMKGCEDIYYMITKDGKFNLKKKGDEIILQWIKYDRKIVFLVNNFKEYKDEESDCIYGGELVEAIPPMDYLQYLYSVKTIQGSITSPKTLVSCKHNFNSGLSPKILDQHKLSMKAFMISLKALCETS